MTVSEKIKFLCERDAYDTRRFLTVCRVGELREIALSIGADTAGVRTEYEMAEKLDYMSAISEKLLFRIGYAQHKHAEEKGTTQCAEITNASDNDNALALQPANDANIQRETNVQPEIIKFEVASKYYKTRNYNGKTLVNSYVILRRIGTSFDVLENITENDGNVLHYINRYSPTVINGIQQFSSIGDCTMNCVRGKYTGGKHNGRSQTRKTQD